MEFPESTRRGPDRDAVIVPRLASLQNDDLDTLATLDEACFSQPWGRREFAAALGGTGWIGYGLWSQEEMIGYALGFAVVSGFHLASVAVLSRYRRRGYARRLLVRVLEDAAGRGCRVCQLEVRASNRAALSLYSSLGFRQVGVRPGYYHVPDEDALVLSRALGKGVSPLMEVWRV